MTNSIKIDLESKDFVKTAQAWRYPNILQVILGFSTFWALIILVGLFIPTIMKNNEEANRMEEKRREYKQMYQLELDRCELENPNNGETLYGYAGRVIKRYPKINCEAFARVKIKEKYGLSPQ
jgi:hypothetical protein